MLLCGIWDEFYLFPNLILLLLLSSLSLSLSLSLSPYRKCLPHTKYLLLIIQQSHQIYVDGSAESLGKIDCSYKQQQCVDSRLRVPQFVTDSIFSLCVRVFVKN